MTPFRSITTRVFPMRNRRCFAHVASFVPETELHAVVRPPLVQVIQELLHIGKEVTDWLRPFDFPNKSLVVRRSRSSFYIAKPFDPVA